MKRLSRFTGSALTTTVSRVGSKTSTYFPSLAVQPGLTQARRFYSTDQTDKTRGSRYQATNANSINRNMLRVNFEPAVYNFLSIYNKCRNEPMYKGFLKQNGINESELPEYSIKDGMIVTKDPVDFFELKNQAYGLLSKHGGLIENHQDLYEKYFKNQVDKLQKDVKELQKKDLTITQLEERLSQLKTKWSQVEGGGKTFMSACLVAEAEGSKVAKVVGKDDYARERQKEREEMAHIMKDMDIFMQGCVVVKIPGAQGLILPNEEIHPSVQKKIGDFFGASGSVRQAGEHSTTVKEAEIELVSTVPPKQGTIITGSSVTINQYYGLITAIPKKYVNYALFCILVFICPTLLYWYFSKSKVNNISHVDGTHDDYMRSHWYNELETKMKTLLKEARTPVIFAITGIGGSGKTQLANDYGSEQTKSSNLVWKIVADTEDNLWKAYRLLAVDLKIDTKTLKPEGEEEWKNRIRYLVNKELAARPGWKLIFDNVSEDLETEVKKYFPKSGTGVVLLTTRNSGILDLDHRLDIGRGLNEDEAEKLLTKISKRHGDKDAKALANELGRLPLSLLIVGYVIRSENEDREESLRQSALPFSCADYRRNLRQLSPKEIEKEQELSLSHLPDGYKWTQSVVIRDAMQRLGKISPDALRLLEFCSYLAPTGIPVELLENFIRIDILVPLEPPENLSDVSIHLKFKELMQAIQRLSLLQKTSGKLGAYDIHRVVQQEGRIKVMSSIKASAILNSVLLSLDRIKQDLGSDASVEVWKVLQPHMEVLADNEQIVHLADHGHVADLLHYSGGLCQIAGNIMQAKYYYEYALRVKESHYGNSHVTVARTLNNLSNVHGDLGYPHKRKELLERALIINQAFYGDRHVQVAVNLTNLAIAYEDLGDYEQQKILATQALDIIEKELGKDHKFTAMVLHALANAYGGLKDYRQQRLLAARALEIHEIQYGKDHEEVAMTLNSLANAYVGLSDLQYAKKLLNRALVIKEKKYGKDNWQYAMTLNDLSNVYIKLDNSQYAIKILEQQVLPIYEKIFGDTSWKMAGPLVNLAQAYKACDDQEQNTILLTRALKCLRNTFDELHPEIIRIKELLNKPSVSQTLVLHNEFVAIAAATPFREMS